LDLAPFQFERLSGGARRYRLEPRSTYGVLPFTDVEVRLPVVRLDPPRASGVRTVSGVAGLALGSTHAFNVETSGVPALALGAEVSLPVGALAPPTVSFIAKGLMTKTWSGGRLHLNVGAGSYSVRTTTSRTGDSSCTFTPGIGRIPRPGDGCGGPPIIVDVPCSGLPAGTTGMLSQTCMGRGSQALAASTTPSAHGSHWFVGAAFDRAIGLRSLVMTADIFAERFAPLYRSTDWTAEIGVRHQITPLLVLDVGTGWHFAGVVRSVALTFGASCQFPITPRRG
jgi:hypothetical protein